MTYTKDGKQYIIRIFRDEEVFEKLIHFCEKEEIKAGVFHGLGATKKAEFGYYDLSLKKYFFTQHETLMEVVSLTGNVSQFEEKPMLHIHALFSDTKNRALGGHVNSMTVGVTLEIHLTAYTSVIERKYDEAIGLTLMELQHGGT